MDLAVRPASPSEEREELIAILERNTPGFPWRAHFKWRHDENPAGPGWSWVVYVRQEKTIVGLTCLFPRPMYLDGQLAMCGQVSQFAVESAYRSLGPAVMLQKATFEPIESGELALCYDCPPHAQGMSTFIRLGMRPSCELTRYVLPLRADEIVEKRFGNRVWTKPLVAGANLLLNLQSGNRETGGMEISRFLGKFGDEFDDLDKAVPSAGIVRSSRSAQMLNWRYRDRFDSKIVVLLARQHGELQGFLAFSVEEVDGRTRASICDLFGRELAAIGPGLLDAAAEVCRQAHVVCLEGYCTETSELRLLLEGARFKARELAARLVCHARSGTPYRNLAWPAAAAELLA